jgi:hypothetical protein
MKIKKLLLEALARIRRRKDGEFAMPSTDRRGNLEQPRLRKMSSDANRQP